jgi:hypothetical protein
MCGIWINTVHYPSIVDLVITLFNNAVSAVEVVERVFIYSELEIMGKESVMACFKILSCYLSGRSEDIKYSG